MVGKRMIMRIAAGVVAGATVIGVPAIALAASSSSGGTGAPAVGSATNVPGGFQQMRQWMDDPKHLQQMGSMMDGIDGGNWSGMHGSGSRGALPTR